MLMTLYCVAPEERRWKRNYKSGEGLWNTEGWKSVERKLFTWGSINEDWNLDGNSDINLQGENLERATLAENGDLDAEAAEMTHRIQSGWKNWKRVLSGILCARKISLRVKGKVYKTVVRPAMMYGAETWAVKKAQEKKLDVAEMRMLRWMSGVT